MKNGDEPKIKLEYYSERFAKKLFKRFPQWKQYAGHWVAGKPDDLTYYFDVLIPSVNPNVSEPLRILTKPQEVIIGWVGNYENFANELLLPNPDYIDQAIEFLAKVVDDQITFCYREQDSKVTGSGFYFNQTEKVRPDMLSTEHGSVIMRSWLGGQDREIHP